MAYFTFFIFLVNTNMLNSFKEQLKELSNDKL